jgi:hypothetical protein
MIVYLGNKKINNLYSGDKEVLNPTTVAQTNNKLDIEYLIVAGGGGGGEGGAGGTARFRGTGGGGGAGGYITGSATLFPNVYPVIVGDGGDKATGSVKAKNGQTSSFLSLSPLGGGGGGSAGDRDVSNCTFGSGSNGASGGGGGSWTNFWGCPTTYGTGTVGQGYDGAVSGGGGSAGPASGNSGGNGIGWLNGVQYAEGGNSTGASKTALGSGGVGGNYFPNSPAAADGLEGVVLIRYQAASAIATGGTITSDGGYIYHFFPLGSYNFTIPSKG